MSKDYPITTKYDSNMLYGTTNMLYGTSLGPMYKNTQHYYYYFFNDWKNSPCRDLKTILIGCQWFGMWSAIDLDCNNVCIRMLGLTLDMY